MKLHPHLALCALPTKECPHCHGTGQVPDERAIGQKARQERESKGLSLREVARRLALSAPYISDLEKGRRNWTAGMLAKYRKVLNLGLAFAALATVTAADTNIGTRTIPTVITNFTEESMPVSIEQPTNGLHWGVQAVSMIEGHTISLSTNRVTNILSILSTTLVPGNCPECGAPNHHSRQVSLMTAYDVVYLTALSQGSSNTMRISTGSATNWVSTNLIPRTVQPYASPGWVVPPLSITNSPVNR